MDEGLRETTVAGMLTHLAELGQDVSRARAYVEARHPKLAALPVTWNPRMRTSAGRCTYQDDVADGIDLNPRLVEEGAASMRQTFLHELAHAMLPPECKHGLAWVSKMAALGAEVRKRHSYESMKRERRARRPRRLVGRCERCGLEVRRRAALPRTREYRHAGRCGGRIERV